MGGSRQKITIRVTWERVSRKRMTIRVTWGEEVERKDNKVEHGEGEIKNCLFKADILFQWPQITKQSNIKMNLIFKKPSFKTAKNTLNII